MGLAFDWLGRIYGVDTQARWGRRSRIVRLVPGTGEIEGSDIPVEQFLFGQSEAEFHEALSGDYFRDWQGHEAHLILAPDQCAGYKVPLQLGGEDDVPNLQVTPVVVCWSLGGQLANAGLVPGTHVDKVSLSD